MKQLVYLTVWGEKYLEEFRLCLAGLKSCEVDIALITDVDFKDERVKVYYAPPPPDSVHVCRFRVDLEKYIDITPYDRVWYMDCDFLVFEDIFSKYSDDEFIYFNAEPGQLLGESEFGVYFNRDMTELEKKTYPDGVCISGGIYSVPKKHYNYFEFLRLWVCAAWVRKPLMWGVEQMVMNTIYLRYRDSWPMKLFDEKDIGFICPRRGGATGDEMILHCTLYQNRMKEIWEAYENS